MSATLQSAGSSSQTATIVQQAQSLSWRVDLSELQVSKKQRRIPQTINFTNANAVFAIDTSGSVMGGILRAEKDLILSVANNQHHRENGKVIAWNNSAYLPISLKQISTIQAQAYGGTDPVCLLNRKETSEAIEKSDSWWLVTDGTIDNNEVEAFATKIVQKKISHIPAVIVVVGDAPTSQIPPASSSISVGASVFFLADHCLFLYADTNEWNKNSGKFYLLQSKGCYEQLGVVESLNQSVRWSDLPTVTPAALANITLPKTSPHTFGGTIRLTNTLFVRIDILLDTSTHLTLAELQELFGDDATRTALLYACKIRSLLPNLRTLLVRHKVEEITSVEDIANAQPILRRLAQARRAAAPIHDLLDFQRQLREAHRRNEEHNRTLHAAKKAQARAFNAIIELTLREIGQIERADYSAERLGRLSNRAARAERISDHSEFNDQINSLMEDSSGVDGFRGECPICYEENAVMALTCKILPPLKTEANTSDYALNFPLACGSIPHNVNVLSSQIACCQCADYMVATTGRTTMRENATVVLPLVSLAQNPKLWKVRLAIGLANRIQVGNLVQLFMAVLDETVTNKGWARPGEGNSDAMFRRDALEWTLEMLWKETETRNNFQESGEIVRFPQAVSHVISEAMQASGSVETWLIRYPMEGFLRIMRFAKKFNAPGRLLDDGLRLFHTRLMALFVENYQAHIKRGEHKIIADKIWGALYELRHGKTPIEGTARIVTTIGNLVHPNDLKRITDFLVTLGHDTATFPFPAATTIILRRLLEIQNHDSVAHCIVNLRSRDTYVIQAFEYPKDLTTADALQVLNEMFLPSFNPDKLHGDPFSPPPFVTPYGPSLLRCGYCNMLFAPSGTKGSLEELAPLLRQGRQAHFAKYLGASGSTGLPQRAPMQNGRLMPPCRHYNLHHSIVLVFAEREEDQRAALVRAGILEAAQRTAAQNLLLEKFVDDVVEQIVGVDRRGNVYSQIMVEQIWTVLPSFWKVVQKNRFDPEQKAMKFVDKLRLELDGLGWLKKGTREVGEIRK
ncbi:hypothetical protein BC938DRAFT_483020 [Jimgerdemannia flammicorona]|uniref:VWFA domain-containing protein n=1 Tax=Jimgerdemannia flammicorona TaxID=994334 RepID=A0A433QCZ5_9FUNG|nr:hypothetical protein BC938DRAFT_483020 [Jimgerdemannia flammicorona]